MFLLILQLSSRGYRSSYYLEICKFGDLIVEQLLYAGHGFGGHTPHVGLTEASYVSTN